MIEITFKDVGQGDSIILEWEGDDGLKKIGIIDCKSVEERNPILEYIKEQEIKNIFFLLLSHPHQDHYSGFNKLLDHCKAHPVKVDYFIHTSNNTPSFWAAAVNSVSAVDDINALFYGIRSLSDSSGMQVVPITANTLYGDIELTKNLRMKIIQPDSSSVDKYAKKQIEQPMEEEHGNLPTANWLSSMIKIYSTDQDWFVLLTSDSQKTLFYYDPSKTSEFTGKLILAQIPHHGAKGNYRKEFWKLMNPKKENIPVVFSVGYNGYKHPCPTVIKELYALNYDLYSTNEVGGFLSSKAPPQALKNTDYLDMFGVKRGPSSDRKLQGDKKFKIALNGQVSVI